MQEEKDTWIRFQEVGHIPQKYFTVHFVPFSWIDPNRFSKERLQKILDKPRRIKVIFNVLIITFILLLVSVITIGVIAFLGCILDDSTLFLFSVAAGIGLGFLREYLIECFPINKHDSNMIVRVKGIRYNSFNERLKSK